MKISALLTVAVSGQDYASDKWSFDDYSLDGKVGHSYNNLNRQGGHEGNRRYCHATLDTLRIYRWDVTMNGYFAHYNPVECMGDELFCAIEERAQFGQINNIRAGCAQMMNHPMVLPRDGNNREWEKKTNIDQDASRGAPLPGIGIPINIFFGIGGCLALPAQNGYDSSSDDFSLRKYNNYFSSTNGGYGNNECLRFQKGYPKAGINPFKVSVCRVCCLAVSSGYTDGTDPICNFWPHGSATTNYPVMSASDFECQKADKTACTFTSEGYPAVQQVSDCEICRKEMFPNFSMYNMPDTELYKNVFKEAASNPAGFCDDLGCIPEKINMSTQMISIG